MHHFVNVRDREIGLSEGLGWLLDNWWSMLSYRIFNPNSIWVGSKEDNNGGRS